MFYFCLCKKGQVVPDHAIKFM